MKKLLLTAIAIGMACAGALAAPAKDVKISFTQSDGTTIVLTKMGDEHCHFFATSDGLAVYQSSNGDFGYLGKSGETSVMAHDIAVRNAAEKSFVASHSDEIGAGAVFNTRSTERKSARKAMRKAFDEDVMVNPHGSPTLPVILIQYTDKKFKDADPVETFEKFLHQEDGVLQYFTQNSFGDFTPNFKLYGPVTMHKGYAYYGNNDMHGDDARAATMMKEACDSLYAQGVDFSQFDNNHDGFADVVLAIYAGPGENSDGSASTIWPHQWSFEESELGAPATYDGTKVNLYGCINETDNGKLEGIGTFVHEFCHCIGLPDLYNTISSGTYTVGNWDVMCKGCYLNGSNTPSACSAFERYYLGWIEVEKLVSKKTLLLADIDDGGYVYKMENPANPDEFFILENRQKAGWDAFLPAAGGMQIMHVDYDKKAWADNTVNNSNPPRCVLLCADNDRSSYNEHLDLFPYAGATDLSSTTLPSTEVHTGGYMLQSLSNIKYQNGIVTCTYQNHMRPSALSATDVEPDSFTANWQPIEGYDTYELFVSDITDEQLNPVVSEDFSNFPSKNNDLSSVLDSYTQVPGWTGYTILGKGGSAVIGSSARAGYITMPQFTTIDNPCTATLEITAKPYGSDDDVQMMVSVNYDYDNSQIIPITGDKQVYYAPITFEPINQNAVTLENFVAMQRPQLFGMRLFLGEFGTPVVHSDIDECSFVVDGLEAEHTYYYQVLAVNSKGEKSPKSNGIAVTTPKQGAVEMTGEDAKITLIDGVLTVHQDAPASVFTTTGISVPATTHNTFTLAPGIYLVKTATTTQKISVGF